MNTTTLEAPPIAAVGPKGYPIPPVPFPLLSPEQLAEHTRIFREIEGPLRYDTCEDWKAALFKARTAAEFWELRQQWGRLPLAERVPCLLTMLREQAADFGVTMPKRWSKYNFERK